MSRHRSFHHGRVSAFDPVLVRRRGEDEHRAEREAATRSSAGHQPRDTRRGRWLRPRPATPALGMPSWERVTSSTDGLGRGHDRRPVEPDRRSRCPATPTAGAREQGGDDARGEDDERSRHSRRGQPAQRWTSAGRTNRAALNSIAGFRQIRPTSPSANSRPAADPRPARAGVEQVHQQDRDQRHQHDAGDVRQQRAAPEHVVERRDRHACTRQRRPRAPPVRRTGAPARR